MVKYNQAPKGHLQEYKQHVQNLPFQLGKEVQNLPFWKRTEVQKLTLQLENLKREEVQNLPLHPEKEVEILQVQPEEAQILPFHPEKEVWIQIFPFQPEKEVQNLPLEVSTSMLTIMMTIRSLSIHGWVLSPTYIPTRVEDGRAVGESGKKLKEEFTRQGFNPLKVHPLWNRKGHSWFAIMEFNKEWDGLKNAIVFEKSFESNHCGKRDYYSSRHQGEKLYGWIARDDDYYSRNFLTFSILMN
ncbi:hypothetical protein SLEP1_g30921 [Rubroshorea leprosula]|uniref:XS domain-containing protein n=1 Tax=Rubroshorea leprosula TaxID=152421 RepID=A0AAV5K742_9ROSI|nr:hypothetical protein SLEP1_g30921 [Rubroshorea leprosula]